MTGCLTRRPRIQGNRSIATIRSYPDGRHHALTESTCRGFVASSSDAHLLLQQRLPHCRRLTIRGVGLPLRKRCTSAADYRLVLNNRTAAVRGRRCSCDLARPRADARPCHAAANSSGDIHVGFFLSFEVSSDCCLDGRT